MTKMVKGKEEEGHLVLQTHGVYNELPITLPFGVTPINGNVQHAGEPYEKIRGVWDGSSPHDGSSPNDHCDLLPDENPPWVTVMNVIQTFCVLLSIGVKVKFWKLDYKAAYCQLHQQVTQTWRQHAYWRWCDEGGDLQGGYFLDSRMRWGDCSSGGVFFRTTTSITVRWITYLLATQWMPQVKCPKTAAWMRKRLESMSKEQAVAASIQGFLDDFWIMVASDDDEDLWIAYELVMWGFHFLGWVLSMSKLADEGSMKETGVILGHDMECTVGTSGV
jgi:hypothetical protein